MQTVAVQELIKRLIEIPENDFVCGTIYEFLRANPVNFDSLSPYLFFSRNGYTRNLIFKNELFEIMTLCWEAGQSSLIHDHADQSCWMTVPLGRLQIKNFRILEQNSVANFCRIEETESFDLETLSPAEVNLEEPIHQVLNPSEFNQRAVSLHIYSRPFERCLIYSTQKHEVRERVLCYTSEYGKLRPEARL